MLIAPKNPYSSKNLYTSLRSERPFRLGNLFSTSSQIAKISSSV